VANIAARAAKAANGEGMTILLRRSSKTARMQRRDKETTKIALYYVMDSKAPFTPTSAEVLIIMASRYVAPYLLFPDLCAML
jgi:hypothetical protein